jgi:DNA-binding MarR family transcriptional regulator
MNAGELHHLSRTLREIATDATTVRGQAPPSAGDLAVVEDVAANPGTSIGEIASRTGFAQSMVSRIVAAMRDTGVFLAEPDPADRRRVLISVDAKAQARPLHQRAARSIEPALRRRMRGAPPARIARAAKLISDLDALLTER